jgi:hypothetical protein
VSIDGEDSFWGEADCYDAFIEDVPALADDAEFRGLFDELFADDLNWDEAHHAYDDLERYLDEHYDLDIDDYFDWEDWRAEHMDS